MTTTRLEENERQEGRPKDTSTQTRPQKAPFTPPTIPKHQPSPPMVIKWPLKLN
jgi:hypothetical protein